MNMSAGLKAFLGLLFAIGVGAFFVVPKLLERDAASVAEQVAVSDSVTGAGEAPAAPAVAMPGTDDSGTASQSASDAGTADGSVDVASLGGTLEQPVFDVLRVEPDGSTVIAGKGEPNSTLNIMNGSTVIASTTVGASGDFAAILDTPLAPGDYQLTLQTMAENGAVQMSEEVATVSIPETPDGELLAMVSKPGKASRIIAQPAAPAPQVAADNAQATPEGDAASDQMVETAATSTDAQGSAESMASSAESPDAPATGIETPPLPEMSSLLTTSAPQIEGGDGQSTGSETASSSSEPAAVGSDQNGAEQTDVAAVSPDVADTAASELPADASVRVDAVEIEGQRIFIAGSATPGYPVTVSADGVEIGTEKADSSGRFILEAEADLAVGDHIINADLMDPASGEILLRATVPFNRPEGETLAAVSPAPSEAEATAEAETAPEADAAAQAGARPSAEGLILPDIASLSKLREEAFEALSALEQMVSADDAPEPADIAPARAAALAKLKAASMADLAAGRDAGSLAVAESMRAQAQAALEVLGADAGIQGAASAPEVLAGDMADMREMLAKARTALSAPAGTAVAAGNGPATDTGAVEGEPRTIQQAPLASAPGAVIIRRGDTLWQISRRTYGQGVRYTTIYLANRSQIQDPDRIQPGQVFSVPDTPLENAEELHRKRLEGDPIR
jgi:nucleoid-associated protein YgaU